MSHIPAAAMPHAHDDRIDGQSDNSDQAPFAPEPTAKKARADAVPVSNDTSARLDDGGTTPPSATVSTPRGASEPATAPTNGPSARDAGDRSSLAITALVIGGLAAVGGIVAALLPLVRPKDEPKSKKRKKRKTA